MIEQATLRKLQFFLRRRFTEKMFVENVEAILNYTADEIDILVEGFVFGMDVTPLVISVPKTWWDTLKRDCFPIWFCRIFPIKYMDIKIDLRVHFPNFRPIDHDDFREMVWSAKLPAPNDYWKEVEY